MSPQGYWSILSIAAELTIVCKGSLDQTNAQKLRDDIKAAVETQAVKSVVLDWVRVDFVDSQALAIPLDLRRTWNFPITLRVAVDSQPARVLKMSSLDAVFTTDFVPTGESTDN